MSGKYKFLDFPCREVYFVSFCSLKVEYLIFENNSILNELVYFPVGKRCCDEFKLV